MQWIKKAFTRFRKQFSLKEIYLEALRGRWACPNRKHRNRSEIAELHDLTRCDDYAASVDDATWHDLDMEDLFDRLDNTTTAIGQQYLYRQLRTYEPHQAELEAQYHTAEYFKFNDEQRELVQLNLWRLRSTNSAVLTQMLFGDLPEASFSPVLAWCLAITSVLTIGIALLFHSFFWLPIVPLIANFIFAESHAHSIGKHSLSFAYLKGLLLVAERLSAIKTHTPINQFEYLNSNSDEINSLRVNFRITGLDSTSGNPLIAQIAYLMNLVCLYDFLVYARCAKSFAEHRCRLRSIYSTVASIDSAIAVGSYMSLVGNHCCPTFTQKMKVEFKQVTHPLLTNAIANDYSSDGESALITGSNMAGKSTFIKAIGTNLILARTLWLCHAKAAIVPTIPIASSIKRTDSLEHGKSYYFAEIETLLFLIERQRTGQPYIFLIDEILHGTNTIERIASATAILETISQGCIVMVTTHDVELTQLLAPTYKAYTFQETADMDKLFDFKLHEGHNTKRNAIKLLESIGFPQKLIVRARTVAQSLG